MDPLKDFMKQLCTVTVHGPTIDFLSDTHESLKFPTQVAKQSIHANNTQGCLHETLARAVANMLRHVCRSQCFVSWVRIGTYDSIHELAGNGAGKWKVQPR